MGIYFNVLGDIKGGTKVKVCQVQRAKEGIVGHDRVEKNVDGGEGGNMGRRRTGGRETVTTRCSADATINICGEGTEGAR